MIPYPVLPATHAVQGDWADGCVGNDGELLKVEPDRVGPVLKLKPPGIFGHFLANEIEEGIDTLSDLIKVDCLFESFDFVAGVFDLLLQVAGFFHKARLLQKCEIPPPGILAEVPASLLECDSHFNCPGYLVPLGNFDS